VLLLVGSVGTAEAKRNGGGWNGGGGKYQGGKIGGSGWNGGGKYQGGKIGSGSWNGGGKYQGGKIGGGGWNGGGKGHKYGRHHKYRFVGYPLAYYGYSNYGYGDNSCYWLRRRALDSGSSYWWNRYYACIDGYGPY
jgi:hypothetical protein